MHGPGIMSAQIKQRQKRVRSSTKLALLIKIGTCIFGQKHSDSKLANDLAKKNTNKQQNTQQLSRDPDLLPTEPKRKQTPTRSSKKLAKTIKHNTCKSQQKTVTIN